MRPLAPLVPLALLLAGCVATPAPDGPAAEGASTVLPWSLTECRYIVGWSEADPAIIQANLPEGFTVGAGTPLGLPVGTPIGRAIIGTEAFECASGTGLEGTIEGMTYASIWIPVTPPEALADPEIDEVYYKIDVLIPDAPRRDAMRALGLSVADGEIAWETALVPNGVAASMTIESAGDFTLELVAPESAAAGDGRRFMEITPAGEKGADGFAVWYADFSWVGSSYSFGNGVITWPEGHWVTQAIGATRAPGQFHAGVWSFEGSVELPRK